MNITFGSRIGHFGLHHSTSRFVYADGQLIGEVYRRKSGNDFIARDDRFRSIYGAPFKGLAERINATQKETASV
jgi:hypothetical protein